MTVLDTEEAAGGAPLELYVFTHAGVSYRYTSADAEVTLPASAPAAAVGTYVPAAIRRTAPSVTDEPDAGSLDVTLTWECAVAQLFANGQRPRSSVTLTIWRLMRDDAGDPPALAMLFQGEAAATEAGSTAAALALHCTPLLYALERTLPADAFQPLCNHFLFDAGCTLDRALYAVAGTVATLDQTGKVLTIAAAAGKPDGYFAMGYLVTPSGRALAIIAHVGTTVTLMRAAPEGELAGGDVDAVTLYPGCDRLYTTCRDKFANTDNFLGFDTMPVEDPFTTRII